MPDPILTEIVTSRLREIAASMEYALYHSGYSPVLRESQDGTAGLTDREGRVIIIGGGLQYHSLPYQRAVRSVLESFPAETLKPGDSFVVNDPYKAGNPHAPDMVAITPGFYRDRLVCFGVSIAHKSDIGGIVPGSSGAAAREIYHDGLLLPPVRYQTAQGVNTDIEAIIANNSRVPAMVLGDLRGQIGCTRAGVQRLAALCEEYGPDVVLDVMNTVIVLTAKRLSDEFAQWPDGEAIAEGYLDHDGADTSKPILVRVKAAKRGGRLTLDFSESSPQTAGPVNANRTTIQAVSLLAVLAASDPSIPVNSGLLEVVDFVIPEGLVLNPRRPATVNHYFPTCHLTYNCVVAALGQLNPSRAVAPSGLGNAALAVGYTKPDGKAAVQYEIMVTGLGGTQHHDGSTIVCAMNHCSPIEPVEVAESEYPVRLRRFDLWIDSAGPGRYRGGLGYVREYEVLQDCIFTARSANHKFSAWGVAGGLAPKTSGITLNPDSANPERLGAIETRRLRAGDVMRVERCGGAGYGDPLERDPDAVCSDVLNGYVSLEAALEQYGVVVNRSARKADHAATRSQRELLRRRASERGAGRASGAGVS